MWCTDLTEGHMGLFFSAVDYGDFVAALELGWDCLLVAVKQSLLEKYILWSISVV